MTFEPASVPSSSRMDFNQSPNGYMWNEHRQTADLSSTESAPSSPSLTVPWSPEASPLVPQGSYTLPINLQYALPTWYLSTSFNELRASMPSTSSNTTISPSQSSPAIQQYHDDLAGTCVNIWDDVFVLDESNGAQDVYIENGAISPHEVDTTPRLQQPLSVQSIISLNPSTVTVTGSQLSPAVPHSTEFLSGHSPIDGESMGAEDNPNHKQDPKVLRITVMNHYRTFMEEQVVLKMFSKKVKNKVASFKNLKASAKKRKHLATFECLINDCDSLFTRKANLENHLKAHLGMTDLICPHCNQGFTTSLRRHLDNCRKTSFDTRKNEQTKSFLDFVVESCHLQGPPSSS